MMNKYQISSNKRLKHTDYKRSTRESSVDEVCGGSDLPNEDADALVNGIPIEEILFEEDVSRT